MEVGPLARMVVGYASGQQEIKAAVDGVLKELNAPPRCCFRRSAASRRARWKRRSWPISLEGWVDQLDVNLAHGKVSIFNPVRWDPGTWPDHAAGYGWHEAPRGSLGHWVEIEGQSIKNYQAVVPTTWNAGSARRDGPAGRV